MSRANIRVFIILATIFLAFSVVAFVIPIPKGATFWVAYSAEVIAIAMQILFFKSAFQEGNELRSKVLGFPIARVGIVYLIVQSVTSCIFFALCAIVPDLHLGISIAVCVVIFGVAMILGVVADASRDVIQQIEESAKRDTTLMRQLMAESKILVTLTNDKTLKVKLEQLAEKFRFSDPVSTDSSAAMEKAMIEQVKILKNMLVENRDEDVAAQVDVVWRSLDERNIRCKSSK